MIDIAVIGGGAAGFMAAISAKRQNADLRVCIYEKTTKTLSKVKISGGGRCNISHNTTSIKELCAGFPRGSNLLKKVFGEFEVTDTLNFFNELGVQTYSQSDNRIFPQSDDSQTVIDALRLECKKLEIGLVYHADLKGFEMNETDVVLQFASHPEVICKRLILAMGGFNKLHHFDFLANRDISIVPPVPSLFSFNVADLSLNKLTGLSSDTACLKIDGQKEWHIGAMLITHWGLSGPAVLRASAVHAVQLNIANYAFGFRVNWINISQAQAAEVWNASKEENAKKQIKNACPYDLPGRLWEYILEKSGIDGSKVISEIGSNLQNKLFENLLQMPLNCVAKTTFKDEFVTAGGINTQEINAQMQLRKLPLVYACGELIDVDGITGGFNFQAAWSTGYVAGKNAALGLNTN